MLRPNSDGAARFGRILAAGAIAALVTACACGKKADRPNVLVIIVDTLRADYLGCYGAKFATTPNIDRLAAGGVRFSQCVTTAPVTLPSISGMLTSSYPVYHGVRDNGIFKLDPSLVTITEVFRESGYSTAAIVGAYVVAEESGIDQGFEHFDSKFSGTYWKESSLLPERADEVSKTQRRASEVTDRAVQWLREADKPFFLVVHYFDPHGPYDPPPSYIERHPRNKYLGEVEYTDANIGPLMGAAETVVGEGALITALIGDHGEGLGQHNEDTHGFFIYDSTILVPLILGYPGPIPPGAVAQRQVSTVDLAPTVLDLAGLPIPPEWQGKSLAGLIAAGTAAEASGGIPQEEEAPRPCYVETYRTRYSYNWSELAGVRHGGWKLVRAPQPELYCTARDPREERNLYDLEPRRVALMEALLDSLIAASSGPLSAVGPTLDLDEEAIGKLEALGYVMPAKRAPPGPLPDPKLKIAELNKRFDSRDLVKKARILMNEGDLEGAESELKKALELDPKNVVAIHDLAVVQYKRGRTEEAVALMKEAIDQEPTSYIPRQHLGGFYLEMERYDDAATVLETAAALNPGDIDIRLGLGLALQKTGDLGGALEQYQKCIELNPNACLGYYRAAFVLVGLGRYEEATLALNEMLNRRPAADLAEEGRKLLAEIEARTR